MRLNVKWFASLTTKSIGKIVGRAEGHFQPLKAIEFIEIMDCNKSNSLQQLKM